MIPADNMDVLDIKKSAGILPLPFSIKGSRIACRSRTATCRAYACICNKVSLFPFGNRTQVNYISTGIYRCYALDFDVEFARFLMVKNKR